MQDRLSTIIDAAQKAVMDHKRPIMGRPTPVLSTLLYVFCKNDLSRFEELLDIIETIQRKTLELEKERGERIQEHDA